MRARGWLLLALVAAGLTACSSPEAGRTRGGGPGADVGNRRSEVEMHAGSRPFYKTPCLDLPGQCAGGEAAGQVARR